MGRFKSLFFSIFLLKRAILHFWHGKTNNNLFQQLVELNRELDCGKFNHSNGPESPWNCLLPANVPRRLSHGPIQFGSSRLPLCCRSTTTKNSSLLPTFPIHESHIILGEVYFSKERFYLIGFWEIFHFQQLRYHSISCQQWSIYRIFWYFYSRYSKRLRVIDKS